MEEICQDFVLIGCTDQFVNRRTDLLGKICGQNVAEVAGRHGDIDRLSGFDASVLVKSGVGVYIIDYLRQETSDIDGIG